MKLILIIFIKNIYENDHQTSSMIVKIVKLLYFMLVSCLIMTLEMMIIRCFYLSSSFKEVLLSVLIFISRIIPGILIFIVTSYIFLITTLRILLIMLVLYTAFQLRLVSHFSSSPHKSFHLKM